MEQTRPPILELKNISKHFPGVQALDDVSLNLYPGEVHAVVGENGAGKSTLMKILSGVYTADQGAVLFDGASVTIHSPRSALNLGIATIYQEFNLVPILSVAENIYLGQEGNGLLPGVINRNVLFDKAQEVLDRLDAKMTKAFGDVLEMSQRQNVYMRDAAYMVAIEKVVKAMELRGWL